MDSPIKILEDNLTKLKLSADSAGANATHKVPIVYKNASIGETIELINNKANDFDTINYIYVVSPHNTLQGVISIKELFKFSNKLNKKIEDIMEKIFIKVSPHADQEKAAHLALKHNIKAVPVVDKDKLLGVISSDKILNILIQEHKEDFEKFAGLIPAPHHIKDSAYRSFLSRVPWIIVGLFGGIASAAIVGRFQNVLEANIILAFFIPLIVYISDSVGTQTQTLMVRDLALNPEFSLVNYLFRQSVISMLIGAVCGLLIALLVLAFWSAPYIGFVVGIACFVAVTASASIAIVIPYILEKLKQDPAIGSGPFATILQDITSIVIYFLVASVLL